VSQDPQIHRHAQPVAADAPDWQALDRLREIFLSGGGRHRDYWETDADLASYDATFAQRIGWKWDHVLAELAQRGWRPLRAGLLDWGCGSGIAARAYLDHFGSEAVTQVYFWDRSPRARRFAVDRARRKYPGLAVFEGLPSRLELVLLSHVLTELTAEQVEPLLALLGRAEAVLWVEPGTHDASRRLIEARERLRGTFQVVAPCTHGAPCGLLAPGNEAHWCHHFAASPPAVFTDPFWGRFARLASVELRSLPLSYLVLDKRPQPALPLGAVRVIGRPRVFKAQATALACDAEVVGEFELRKRDQPAVFRRWSKGNCPGWQVWERVAGRILNTVELPSPAATPTSDAAQP